MSKSVRRLSAAVTAGAISVAVLSTLITGTAAHAAAPATVEAATRMSSSKIYTVRPGDTLSGIAARHGVALAAVLKINKLRMRSVIYPGQKILLKAAASAPAAKQAPAPRVKPAPPSTKTVPAPGGKIHTVKPGDTLAKIAARYGVSLSSVLQGNGMNLKSVIHPGQKIKIGTPATRSKPAPVKTRTTANLSPAQLKTMVAATARRMGVEPSLALAFARQESSFRQHVTSSAGAIGTMQVMPASGEWAAQLVGRPLDLRNAQDNITAGVAIISALLSTSPSKEIAVASYYQGQYSVMNRGMYADTKGYVASVLKHQKKFR